MGYFTCVMSSVIGNLCNKCPKWPVKHNSSCSDYFNVISGFTSNSRAPGGPVTFFLNVSLTKIFVITVKGLEPATSRVRDQDATTVQARYMGETGSLN